MPDSVKHTDQSLIKGCLENDRKSQEILYRKYFGAMLRMVQRYTKDQEAAQEIINNGFLRAFKKLDTFTHQGSLEGWLRKLVFHSLSEYFKQHNKYTQLLVFEESVKAPATNGAESALHQMYYDDVMKLVDTLPPATRQVFELYAIEGFSHMEISKQVNISIGTSKWHLSTARKQLQSLISNNNNYTLHAG
ncbi:MAG: RNA polymerase sigma factor (sigma-70 family) [Polaribacter sp.]|jgi:RNA polymerase sigma factor (sigma-70 family)